MMSNIFLTAITPRYVLSLNLVLLLFPWFSLVHADGPELELEYKWEKGHLYTYEISHRPFGTRWETQIADLGSVHGTETSSVLLHVSRRITDLGNIPVEQRNAIQRAFSEPVFICMDERGEIKWVRVPRQAATESMPVTDAQMFLSQCADIFFLPYLPSYPIETNQVWKNGPRRLRVTTILEGGRGETVCRIERTKREVVDIVDFDLESGNVVRMVSKNDELMREAVLTEQKAIARNDFEAMLQSHQESVTLDHFIRAVGMPRWRDEALSPAERRNVYRLLQHLEDEQSRGEIDKDALSTDMGRVTSMAWMGVALSFERTENRGLELAVAATGSGNRDVEYQAASLLQDVAGIQLTTKHQWSEWINRIRSALPDMLNSTSPTLAEQTSHKDPFVRLFALRQLSERSDVDMEPILENAASDQDEKVQAFASATLKKLKEKAQKKK